MDWVKILSAILLVGMLIFLYPSLKHASKNSPKGTTEDWMSAIKPLALVVLFIIVLIMLVR